MRFITAFFALALLSNNPAFGDKKEWIRNWQNGKILDSNRASEFAGTVDQPGVVLTNGIRLTNDSKRAVYRREQILVIESDAFTYVSTELLGRKGKPANVTVNGPVKFAIDGRTLYFIDDDYNEHKTEIVKKILRTPGQSRVPKP